MKPNFSSFLLISILVLSFTILKCKKEDFIEKPTKNPHLTTRTLFSNPLPNYASISNGIVQFANWTNFQNYSSFLETFNNDPGNYQLALNYLAENNITASNDPVLDVIELMNQFISSRRLYDSLHNLNLLNDDDPLNNVDHFMMCPTKEAVLNEYNEVKIGSIYFRLIDPYRTLIVGNSDLSKFISTRGLSDFQPYNNSYNIFLIDLNIADIGLLFNESENNSWESIKQVVSTDFRYVEQANGSVKFENTTFFDDGVGTVPNFKWTFSNGYEYYGFEPPVLTFSANDFPLSCTLNVLNNNSENNTISKEIFLACYRTIPTCQINKTVTINLTNEPWFSYYANCPQNSWVWNMGDGTIKTGHPVSHTYTTNDPSRVFTIKGEVLCNGRCVFTGKTSINNKCNYQGIRREQYTKDIGSTKYYLDGEVWVSESIFSGSAGSSSTASVRIGTSPKLRFNSLIRTTYQGDFFYNRNNCCYLVQNPYSPYEGQSNKITAYTVIQNIRRLRYLPNQFWSTHRVKISENNFLESNGNLYLQ